MVKLIREFILPTNEERSFHLICENIPGFLNREEDGYHILEEIEDTDRLYRKTRIEKKSFVDDFPTFIKDKLPISLLQTSTKLMEESIYEFKNHQIKWKIYSEMDDIYVLSGTTKFIRLNENSCKVMILMYLDFHHLEHYFPNPTTRKMILPFLETKMPDFCIENVKRVYKEIVDEYNK
jgi:hypothetical protein